MKRWLWLCPALAITLAAGVLAAWGLSWGTALLAVLLLVCPLLVLWGALTLRRSPEFPREPVPVTPGMTFGWVLPAFLVIAAFFLFTEHRAHLFGILPYLLLLACPLMHLFMHHGHGGHGHPGHQAPKPPADRQPRGNPEDGS